MHHLCFEVDDIIAARDRLECRGAGAGRRQPKIGAHGKPVLFLHPKDFAGTLIELDRLEDKLLISFVKVLAGTQSGPRSPWWR